MRYLGVVRSVADMKIPDSPETTLFPPWMVTRHFPIKVHLGMSCCCISSIQIQDYQDVIIKQM
jgi:hypothetical protein